MDDYQQMAQPQNDLAALERRVSALEQSRGIEQPKGMPAEAPKKTGFLGLWGGKRKAKRSMAKRSKRTKSKRTKRSRT